MGALVDHEEEDEKEKEEEQEGVELGEGIYEFAKLVSFDSHCAGALY